jgi:hypothetical protein
MKPIIYIFFTGLLFCHQAVWAKAFDYSKDSQGWAFWGSGIGQHDKKVGNNKKGSLYLAVDWSEEHTAHYHWNLKKGTYKVSFHAQAFNVQKGQDNISFWHFYNVGKGIQSIFQTEQGTFGWKKYSYTIEVEKELDIWFRLKAPGKVWIDDFKIELVKSAQKYQVGKAKKFKTVIQEAKAVSAKILPSPRKLLPKKVTNLTKGKYFNFPMSKLPLKDWRGYDRIHLTVHNPTKSYVELYMVVADTQSNGYWGQLNHKTHLAPGKNKLSFSLDRYVGERGSVKFRRKIKLNKLSKIFVVVDPDKKSQVKGKFALSNIYLSQNQYPPRPSQVMAFDFTSHKASPTPGFISITTQSLYNNINKMGFYRPKFWRVHDDQFVPYLDRYSIGILNGQFRIDLPNGKYRVRMIVDRLGYWDVPFWTTREVNVQEKEALSQVRREGQAYLRDYLMLERHEPLPGDNPHDLLLENVFKPIEALAEVINGQLVLEFKGDASAISLNSLYIWPLSAERDAREYLDLIAKRKRKEFDWMARDIGDAIPQFVIKEKLKADIVKAGKPLYPTRLLKSEGKKINLQGGINARPYSVIQLVSPDDTYLSWSLDPLKSKDGLVLEEDKVQMKLVHYHFTSPDLNHETYTIAGKFLRKASKRIHMDPNVPRYLWIQLKVTPDIPKGEYSSNLRIKANGQTINIPITFHRRNYTLPRVDFPVGFIGLDPIPAQYFPDKEIERVRNNLRMEALFALEDRGFTTFSGLPAAKLKTVGGQIKLETPELDKMFKSMMLLGMNQEIFTYGGDFPQKILKPDDYPTGFDEQKYFRELSKALREKFESWPKTKIVHTFSDEASGYSDRVYDDALWGQKLKNSFPFMKLAGFSSMLHSQKEVESLHQLFDYGIYSGFDKRKMTLWNKKKKKWGAYNLRPGALENPQISFGPVLYAARKQGLSHYLEWHMGAFHNYPYYDLDGRESDIAMLYPAVDGSLYPSIKFELAANGLEVYRKLKLLEQKVQSGNFAPVKKWLQSIEKEFSLPNDMRGNFMVIERKLDLALAKLYP